MAGTVLRKAGAVLFIILKGLLWAAFTALKLLCRGIRLFLLLLFLAMRLVLAVAGISDAG